MPRKPKNPPKYYLAKENPLFSYEHTVLMRFVHFKHAVACLHCGKQRRKLWTMTVPFRAIVFDDIPGPALTKEIARGMCPQLYMPLTPVCDDHLLDPASDVLEEMARSLHFFHRLVTEDPLKRYERPAD